MFHRWAALALVLALCAMSPKNAAGQTKPRGRGAGTIGKNWPNPFNPTTNIPFSITDATGGCASDDRQLHEVTLQIVNILSQQVAVPVLKGNATSTSTTPTGPLDGALITKLQLSCGDYLAFWNGKNQSTGKDAASGIYIVLFTVDRSPAGSRRIFLAK